MFADDFCETMKISDAHECCLLSSCTKKEQSWFYFFSFGGDSDAF